MSPAVLPLLILLAGAPPPEAPPTDRVATFTWPEGEAPAPLSAPAEAEPTWVVHEVLPNEQLDAIAARYGVSERSVRRGNHLEGDTKLRSGQRLRIYARRAPAPRRQVAYRSEPGDTWVSVSVAFGVRYRELRAWNWQHRGDLRPGRDLVVYVEQDPRRSVYEEPPSWPRPEISVPAGAMSVGKPQRGRLVDGVRLGDTPLYELRWPEDSWASSHAARVVLEAVARFRWDAGYGGRLVLGAMSRWKGGRFHPHKSHRSGRDIDVYLPLVAGTPATFHPGPHDIDWYAAWALAVSFLQTGEVEAMYLDRKLHRYLFEAGRHLGASPELLAKVVEWPNGDGPRRGVPIRHGADHTRHFHIRLRCGADEPECVTQRWGDRVPRAFPWPERWGAPNPELWRDAGS